MIEAINNFLDKLFNSHVITITSGEYTLLSIDVGTTLTYILIGVVAAFIAFLFFIICNHLFKEVK